MDLSGVTGGIAGLSFGNLRVCGLNSGLNNRTVAEILSLANTALGGGLAGFSITDIGLLVIDRNGAYLGGVPSSFAQDHLVNGSCP